MEKKGIFIRVSIATRRKLDELRKLYGTQAEAVAVAIDRLYRQEVSEGEDDGIHLQSN